MAKHSEEWSRFIRDLLDKYNLTYRAAQKKTNSAVSASTIFSWTEDWIIPGYMKAREFLEFFPEERDQGMIIAGYSVPDEWKQPKDSMELLDEALLRMRRSGKLTDEGREQVLDFVTRMLEKAEENHKTSREK
jgi:hypothetical protein